MNNIVGELSDVLEMDSTTRSKRLVIRFSFLLVLITLNFRAITTLAHGEGLYIRGLKELSNSLSGRVILERERENITQPMRYLADTIRVDPLDNFEKYKGGYDITNKHYWSSTVFTGIYGYTIGAVWLLCGMVCGGFLLITTLCHSNEMKKRKVKKTLPCSRQCYLWPVLLGTSFTILAIVASGFVLGGTSKFHSRAKTVIKIIIDTADGASGTIYNVTGAMKGISDNFGTSNENSEASSFLNSTSIKLDSEANEISRQAKKNRRLINKALKIVYLTTTITISLNLIAVIVLSITGFLKLRRPFYMLIILCWLLAVLCWMFFGMYFFLEKFTGDTCTALKDFQQDPYNNSLSSILPCDELDSAKSVLQDTGVGIYNLINEVNANISASPFPNMVRVCNPFSAPPEYHYHPENCPANTIRVGDIPQVLKIFTCSNEDTGTCKEGEFISTNDFKTVESYTSSIQNLLDAFPGMENLVDCQVVTDAFNEILSKHCKPMKKYVKMVWASLVTLSTVMMVSILIWVTTAHHDRKRHFSDGSIDPYAANIDTLESSKKSSVDPEK